MHCQKRKIKNISWNNTDKKGHSKTMRENSTNIWEEMTQKYTKNRMQEKPNDFRLKYDHKNKKKEHNRKAKRINTWLKN